MVLADQEEQVERQQQHQREQAARLVASFEIANPYAWSAKVELNRAIHSQGIEANRGHQLEAQVYATLAVAFEESKTRRVRG